MKTAVVDAAVDAKAVRFAYHRRVVLDGVDLRVRAGEFVGLLGPNGSGKSTFLKNLLGYLKPSSGTVSYAGAEGSGAAELSRLVAFVPQQTSLRMPVTVMDAVLMGRLPHLADRWAGYSASDKRKARETIAALALERLADRPVTHLSGGELQKVVIARCLAQESEVLLLDEATSGLDLNHSVEIMELMRRKAKTEGKTVVAVLHDLNLAASFCDRVALLKDGRVRYEGAPTRVISADVLEDVYGFRAEVGRLDDGSPFVLPRRAAPAAVPAAEEAARVS